MAEIGLAIAADTRDYRRQSFPAVPEWGRALIGELQ
jgi:hypothetical protein